MPRLMGGAVVASLLFSYGHQVAVHSIGATSFGSGASVGVAVWLAFAVTHSLNTQFEGRKPVVLVINNVLYAITYIVFGGVLAIWSWGPSIARAARVGPPTDRRGPEVPARRGDGEPLQMARMLPMVGERMAQDGIGETPHVPRPGECQEPRPPRPLRTQSYAGRSHSRRARTTAIPAVVRTRGLFISPVITTIGLWTRSHWVEAG